MGFKRKRPTVTLKFADPDYEGFVIEMRRMSIEDSFLFGDLRQWESDVHAGRVAKSVVDKQLLAMHTAVADAVIGWNLEDDQDNPIPVSVAAIRAEDPDFFWTLVRSWIMAMDIGVSADTKAPSSGGKPSEELQIPMEPLSDDLAS